MFFGAVNHVRDSLRYFHSQNPSQKHVAIVASGVNFLDVAGAEFLAQEARQLKAEGGALYLVNPKEGVRAPLKRGGYTEEIGEENLFASKKEALAQISRRLDRTICRNCTRQVFNECAYLAARDNRSAVSDDAIATLPAGAGG